MFTETLSQQLSLTAAGIAPANRAANTYTVTEVDMRNFRRALAYVAVGPITAGNVQAYFQSSAENNANYANITGANTLTFTTNNTEGTLEIRADQLTAGTRYLQLAVVINTGPANITACVFGGEAGYKPASQYDHGSVVGRLVHPTS